MTCEAPATQARNDPMGTGTGESTPVAPLSAPIPPRLSIVVPTRNEAGNIEQLVSRLLHALAPMRPEIVFVDDSDDNTPAVVEGLARASACEIVLLHRPPRRRGNGLGGAVVEGLRAARAPWVCVMDADLQHPPEIVPRLFARTEREDVDVVVASRYCDHGEAAGLSRLRGVVSRSSTMAARIAFPVKLRNISDPMSGFFMVRKAALDLATLQPRGFKILLEILARTPVLRTAEVEFRFGTRFAGRSKASLREGMRYLAHLSQLRFGAVLGRPMRFLLVGLSGLFVNMLLLAGMTELLGLHYLVAALGATLGSSSWNFGLTEGWVFRDRQQASGRALRFAMFLLMNTAALSLRGPMMYALTTGLGMHYLMSNLISLVALTVLRYTLADNLIWKGSRLMKAANSSYNYDIHGIITVQSEGWLPELEHFLVEAPIPEPTIRVRIGDVKPHRREEQAPAGDTRRITYKEGLGSTGFAVEIVMGKTIDVTASALLRHSPHVLYTNVVEPILRWTFVEKGYVLVHGACLVFGKDAYLITARTDTGKTTTMLRVLARQRRAADTGAFLSDDLTLLAPDGQVFTYPKPLTISHHTVRAINSAMLSRRERFTLPFQSRIHSRSGRRFAFLLAATRLPVATINTLVQMLVPPPKYHVDRLVHNARTATRGKLAGMFVIERGGNENIPLGAEDALEILMQNCDDAYGFPPYPAIKDFLHSSNNAGLQAAERRIVAAALEGLPTTLLRSSTLDWSLRIEALAGTTPRREEAAPTDEQTLDLSPAIALMKTV